MKTEADTTQLLIAIRKHCLKCSCGDRKQVENCEIKNCDLYPFRSLRSIGHDNTEKQLKGQMSLFEVTCYEEHD